MSDSDDRSSFERPLEALVFAPLGFVLEARQMYPRFVDRGRNQILLARLVGRYATRQAMTTAGEVLERNAGPATDVLRLVGIVPPVEDGVDGPPAAAGADEVDRRDDGHGGDDAGSTPPDHLAVVPDAPAEGARDEAEPLVDVVVPDPASLAIPDYDSLAASQVVPRLDALDDDELEAVRCYESGVRGRKTILAKIAQLQAG